MKSIGGCCVQGITVGNLSGFVAWWIFHLPAHQHHRYETTLHEIMEVKIDEIQSEKRDQVVHDTYGDEAACIIVDERGKLVLDDVYNGFDDDTLRLLDLEVKEVPEMPDPALSVQDMKDYGYAWAGVLPVGQEAAEKALEKGCEVYRLYSDNTEGLCVDAKEIADHAAKGGMLGISKESWMTALEKENYLKAAEMSMEDDYGMIDGIINNGPKEDKTAEVKAPERGEKSSIIENEGVTHFITGMALGVDMYAAEIVLDLKSKYPHITLESAIPCETQAIKWSVASRERYYNIAAKCDKETMLQREYTPDCMDKRNRYMVDHADYILAVWNGCPSGTGNTVRYAHKKGKSIIVINPVSLDVTRE